MKPKKLNLILLCLIFILFLAVRLHFSLQEDYFSDDESYYHLQQLESNILTPSTLHIISEVFLASIILLVFFIAFEITKKGWPSLLAAILPVFSPLLFKVSFNSLSIYKILIPLFLLIILSFIKIKDRKFQYLFLASSFLLALIHPLSLIIPLILICYVFILLSKGNKLLLNEKVSLIIAIIFILLIQFIEGQLYGFNLVLNIIEDQFIHLTIASFSYLVGFLPLVLGLIGLYFGYFKESSKQIYLITSIIISLLLLLSLELITMTTGIILLGVTFSILSAVLLSKILDITKKSKLPRVIIPLLLIIILIFATIIPAIQDTATKPKLDIEPILWLKDNTLPNTKILANTFEGNLVRYFAKRNVVIHYPFTVQNAHKRFKDTRQLYTIQEYRDADKLLQLHHIDYIYISPQTKGLYNIEEISYINDRRFNKIFDNSNTQVWEVNA